MKRYGKFEKRPDETEARQPKMKSLLLQTYVLSVLCLVLCMSMFLGSSYAWFTSEVNNTSNEIYIGTLDVGLFNSVGDLANPENELFSRTDKWGPGLTNLETVKIVNEGDLDFKYELSFTDGVLKETDENEVKSAEDQKTPSVAAIAECFDVLVFDNEGTAPYSDDPYEKDGLAPGWNHFGSLKDWLDGKTKLTGTLGAGTDKANLPTHEYTIALHMREDASPSLANTAFGLTVKLVAYQLTNEEGNQLRGTSLDTLTAVSNLDELEDVLSEGIDALLTSDIEITDEDDCIFLDGGLLQGSNSTISYTGGMNDAGNSVGVLTSNGGSLTGLTIDGGANGRALYSTGLTSHLSVSDCTLSGAYAFNLSSNTKSEYVLKFTNTKFKSWTSFANAIEHASFIDCEFEDVLRPYGDTTLTNCTFTRETLDLSELEDGEAVYLVDCEYQGIEIENAILTAENGTIKVDCAEGLLTLSPDNTVILAGY